MGSTLCRDCAHKRAQERDEAREKVAILTREHDELDDRLKTIKRSLSRYFPSINYTCLDYDLIAAVIAEHDAIGDIRAAYENSKVEAVRHRVSWEQVEKENKELRESDVGKLKAELCQVRADLKYAENHIDDLRDAGRLICGIDD